MEAALQAAIEAGDDEAVLTYLARLSPDERRSAAAGIRQLAEAHGEGGWVADGADHSWQFARGTDGSRQTSTMAVWVTATASELAKVRGMGPHRGFERFVAAVTRVPPPWLNAEGLQTLAESGWLDAALANALVEAGVAEFPPSDALVESLVMTGFRSDEPLADVLRGMPAVLQHLVYRVFEVEGGQQSSLAAADKYRRESNQWTTALRALAATGELDRQRLIDASLDALGRDYAAFRAGWFTRFHDALSPTPPERAARAGAYLRLIGSATPATVAFAVKAVEALVKAKQVDHAAVAHDLAPALTNPKKGTVTRALKLLQRVAKSSPDLAAEAAELALSALVHEDAGVQVVALDAFDALVALADESRRSSLLAALADQRDLVAPSLQTRLPVTDAAPAAAPPVVQTFAATPPVSLRAAERAVTAVATAPEAVALTSQVLENPAAEAFERAIDAVARFASADVGELGAPLAKRAGDLLKRHDVGEWPLRSALARLAIVWVTKRALADPTPSWARDGVNRFLTARIGALADRLVRGVALPLLSAPTHRGGAVTIEAFRSRLAAWTSVGQAPDAADAVLALMRLPPSERGHARGLLGAGDATEAAALDEAAAVVARRYTPSVSVRQSPPYTFYSVDCDVSPAVDAPSHDLQLRRLLAAGTVMQPAGVALRGWCALMEPDDQGLFFRDGLFAVGWAMDEELTSGGHLGPALEPATTLGVTGHWLLALCLGARGPRAVERGLDAAIDGLERGQVSVEELGAALAAVLSSGMGKGARYAKSLATVAQASEAHAVAVARLLQRALRGAADSAPRDVGKVLLLLNELLIATDGRLDDEDARAWLRTMTRGGQVATAKKALLTR